MLVENDGTMSDVRVKLVSLIVVSFSFGFLRNMVFTCPALVRNTASPCCKERCGNSQGNWTLSPSHT